jgi:hypothetical protein
MAYPTVNAPYGLKPINLIGGQVFAGQTRELPIASNYGTAIYNGDIVRISSGVLVKETGTTTVSATGVVGVFLGCTYTNPSTGQNCSPTTTPVALLLRISWPMSLMILTNCSKLL